MPAKTDAQDSAFVQSFARGLEVIASFTAEAPRLNLSEVAEATGLARATARRLLHTLVDLGYAGTDGRVFWLTPRVLSLGYSYLSALQLPEIARPHLHALAQAVNESSSMSVLDGADIVYVARVPINRIMSITITLGTRLPAHNTSMGRTLLSEMSETELAHHLPPRWKQTQPEAYSKLINDLGEVRDRGFALVDQELQPGLRSVAAPVRGNDGSIIAAINIASAANAHTLREVTSSIAPAVVATARAISNDYLTVSQT